MKLYDEDDYGMPLWVKLLIIASCLPVLALPLLISRTRPGFAGGPFLMIYPMYVIASAFFAWHSYRQEDRKDLAWILISLMWLTHAAMWALVLYQ